jgi:hypothetical protein
VARGGRGGVEKTKPFFPEQIVSNVFKDFLGSFVHITFREAQVHGAESLVLAFSIHATRS